MSLAVVLFIIFMVLKLTHVIAWSWLVVSLPLIIAAVLNITVFMIFKKAFTGRYGL